MSNQNQISFGEAVEFQGQTAVVVSDGARVGVRETREPGGKINSVPTQVVDLAVFKPVKDGAGKVKNVVGTAERDKLVGWLHDIPVDQVQRAEDWFFTLTDDELEAVTKERARRNHEKAQAAQAQAAEAQKAKTLAGVKIRPSKQLLETAEKLWKDSIRAENHAGEHDEIVLPNFDAMPEEWAPWIEKAKSFLTRQAQAAVADASDFKPETASPGLKENLEKLGVKEEGNTNEVDTAEIGDEGSGSVN